MKRRFVTTLVLACSVMACFAAAVDLSGKWVGTLATDSGDYPITYTFKIDGDKLSGNAETGAGDLPISDGKIKGDSVFFNVSYNGTDIPNTGKCYRDSIAMNITFGGVLYHTVLKHEK